jgi:hypothetical protein
MTSVLPLRRLHRPTSQLLASQIEEAASRAADAYRNHVCAATRRDAGEELAPELLRSGRPTFHPTFGGAA